MALLGYGASVAAADPWEATPASLTERQLPSLVKYYEALHADPELSRMEAHTSADLARELRGAGFEVIEHLGQYTVPGQQGYGVVGILRNGAGPTVLIRADMDALPAQIQRASDSAKGCAARLAGVDIPSFQVKANDAIEVSAGSKKNPTILHALEASLER